MAMLTALLSACAAAPAPSTSPEPEPEPPVEPPVVTELEPTEPATDSHTTHRPSPEPEATKNREGCQAGDPVACHAAALDAYYATPASTQTDRSAYERFSVACDLGYAPSCSGLGVMIMQGRAGPVDTSRALRLFVRACEAGASTGCHQLADAARSGQGLPPDPALAERATARARCAFEASLGKTTLTSCPALGPVDVP